MGAFFTIDPKGVVQLKPERFADGHLEDNLQDWCDRSPELLNDGRPLLSLGREIPTKHRHYIDNLFLDAAGGLVVAELKRGTAPSDINSQLLNYAAFAENVTSKQIEELCVRHTGRTLESRFREVFGVATPKNLPTSHRFVLVAERFDAHAIDQCRLLTSKGFNIACLEFKLYMLGDQRTLHVEPVFGEIPRVDADAIVDPHIRRCQWVFEQIRPLVREIAARQAWELDESVSDYVYSFAPKAWPKCKRRLYDRAFGVYFVWRYRDEEWFGVSFNYRQSVLPDLGSYLKRRKKLLSKTFTSEIDDEGAWGSHYVNLKLPEIGDLKALAVVKEQLEKLVTGYVPVVTEYFAGK